MSKWIGRSLEALGRWGRCTRYAVGRISGRHSTRQYQPVHISNNFALPCSALLWLFIPNPGLHRRMSGRRGPSQSAASHCSHCRRFARVPELRLRSRPDELMTLTSGPRLECMRSAQHAYCCSAITGKNPLKSPEKDDHRSVDGHVAKHHVTCVLYCSPARSCSM